MKASRPASSWSTSSPTSSSPGGRSCSDGSGAATQAAARADGSTTAPLVGGLLGILTAVALGWAVYQGALRLNLARFFAWTGGFLVLVAAGVPSYGVHDLQEAGLLPGLQALAFDVSKAVPPTSWFGTLLKGTLNFSPATTWLQAAAWLLYVIPTMSCFVRVLRRNRPPAKRSAPPAAPVTSTSPTTPEGASV